MHPSAATPEGRAKLLLIWSRCFAHGAACFCDSLGFAAASVLYLDAQNKDAAASPAEIEWLLGLGWAEEVIGSVCDGVSLERWMLEEEAEARELGNPTHLEEARANLAFAEALLDAMEEIAPCPLAELAATVAPLPDPATPEGRAAVAAIYQAELLWRHTAAPGPLLPALVPDTPEGRSALLRHWGAGFDALVAQQGRRGRAQGELLTHLAIAADVPSVHLDARAARGWSFTALGTLLDACCREADSLREHEESAPDALGPIRARLSFARALFEATGRRAPCSLSELTRDAVTARCS